MPLKPTDTSTDTLKKSGPDVFSGKTKNKEKNKSAHGDDREKSITGVESEPNQANYGFGHDAELNTEAEETEDQEYLADGLPRTNKYSVDDKAKGA